MVATRRRSSTAAGRKYVKEPCPRCGKLIAKPQMKNHLRGGNCLPAGTSDMDREPTSPILSLPSPVVISDEVVKAEAVVSPTSTTSGSTVIVIPDSPSESGTVVLSGDEMVQSGGSATGSESQGSTVVQADDEGVSMTFPYGLDIDYFLVPVDYSVLEKVSESWHLTGVSHEPDGLDPSFITVADSPYMLFVENTLDRDAFCDYLRHRYCISMVPNAFPGTVIGGAFRLSGWLLSEALQAVYQGPLLLGLYGQKCPLTSLYISTFDSMLVPCGTFSVRAYDLGRTGLCNDICLFTSSICSSRSFLYDLGGVDSGSIRFKTDIDIPGIDNDAVEAFVLFYPRLWHSIRSTNHALRWNVPKKLASYRNLVRQLEVMFNSFDSRLSRDPTYLGGYRCELRIRVKTPGVLTLSTLAHVVESGNRCSLGRYDHVTLHPVEAREYVNRVRSTLRILQRGGSTSGVSSMPVTQQQALLAIYVMVLVGGNVPKDVHKKKKAAASCFEQYMAAYQGSTSRH
ncbi:hypothetical protein FOL47_005945 [Perkinsus chesapeaki]|uniref:Uncharacterized protein n=1 Tax=Perkinsus chesapeaki TaxID=330153 RepID=A0A7J6MXZ4_PERCH|nr:hypothetical protein FOL47_005945 [Perkinsus chesapeaki]